MGYIETSVEDLAVLSKLPEELDFLHRDLMNLRHLVHTRNVFADQIYRFVPSKPRSSTTFLGLLSKYRYKWDLTYQISHYGKIRILYIWHVLP